MPEKIDWDELINDTNLNNKWSKFLLDLGIMRLLNAPRHVLCCEERGLEIYGFCDSSGKGYGACAFVRAVCEHGITVKFWTSKCRLAPVKEISIPRLELLACFLLSKLIASVKTAVESEVEIVRVFCWTDSQIVLWWIRQVHKEWKVWVQSRVEEIRENVDSKNWSHVPTALNPADICTRECSIKRLKECALWWNGPKFLLVGEEMWPSQDFLLSEDKDLDENVVDPCKESSINVSGVENVGVGEVIDIGRFSSLETLLRVTGYVMRFVRNLKKVSNKGEGVNGELLLEEVENTKLLWVKLDFDSKNPSIIKKLFKIYRTDCFKVSSRCIT